MNFLTNLLGVLGSGFNSLFGLVTSTMQKGFQAAIQFHKEGVAFARETGLSAKQAQAYTETLIQRTQVLANKYGVSAEAIAQVQRGLSEATGKQLMLNDAQAEGFVQINKLVGAQNASKFTEEIMNGMGGQIDTVQGAISKVYATAAKQGLNAKKLTDKVAQNLGMANRLSFRNGINGLTRMAALSEKLGINMASVESAAGQFMDLDKAIENAAQMQMLGGSAAVNFGNPLTAAYEANYDPEAFAKRMSDSLGSYATFDAKTGMSNINGMNMDFVRNIAKTMGISVEEASKMAKKQAEVKYKENQFGSTLDKYGLNEDQKNFLINNSQVKNGELVYTDAKGVEHNVNQEGISPELIDEMQRIANMSDKDIMLDQASHLKSIDEQITGAQSKVAASFAEGLQPHIDGIRDNIEGLGDFFSEYAKVWGADTGRVVGEAMAWINENGETIKNVASGILDGVTKVFDFVSKHWKELLIAVASWKLIGKPLIGGPGGLGAKAAKGIMGKLGSSASKGLKIGGAALGVGIGAYKAFTADNNADRGEGIGTAVGAVVGTAIAGPIGSAVGGWLGGEGGRLIGEHWESIKDFAKGAWESTKEFASSAWDATKDFASGVWNGIKDLAKGIWNLVPEDARKAISDAFDAVAPIAKEVWKGIKVYAEGVWAAVKGAALGVWSVVKGTALGAWSIIKGAALGVWEVAKGAALGVWEVVKGVWEGLWDVISAPFKAISDVVEGVKTGVAQIFDGHIIDGIMSIGGGIFKGLWDLISAPFKAIYDVGAGVFNGIGEVIKGVWNGVGEFVKGVWNGIGEFVKGIWNGVGEFVKGLWEGITGIWDKGKNWVKDKWDKVTGGGHAEGGFINSGARGVEHPVLAQKDEVILNPTQQKNFMAIANGETPVKSKPVVGENSEYIYKPNGTETSNVNGNTITVKDFNINLSGTLRLDGGNSSKNIDMNALLNDYQFMNALKEMIKTSINNDMNGGRFMNDLATLRGQISSSSIIGR